MFTTFTRLSTTCKNVLVYAGPGVGKESLNCSVNMLRELTDVYSIHLVVNPQVLHQDSWIKNTALFVLPGGADLPYVHALFGAGTDNIKQYVHQGGKFIGICAGQYFSAANIEFKSEQLNVSGERFLRFFPGKIIGPAFPTLPRFVNVCTADAKFSIQYNGGGRFVDPEKYDCVKVVATYEDGDAAIVKVRIGEKGRVILSGVHFEKPDGNGQLELAKNLLASLGIGTKLEIPCPKLKLGRS